MFFYMNIFIKDIHINTHFIHACVNVSIDNQEELYVIKLFRYKYIYIYIYIVVCVCGCAKGYICYSHQYNSNYIYIYIYIGWLIDCNVYTGVWQNNGNTRKFQTNLFLHGFLIVAHPWNPALCSSILTIFEGTGFSRRLLRSAVIFGAIFLWYFQTIQVRVKRSLLDSFRFLPEITFSEEVFPSFSNAIITSETEHRAASNNSAVFETLAPAIKEQTIWPLLNSNISAILMNFH